MKKIKFTCTNCDAKLRVPTHLAGVSAPCPKCGTTITAPSDITEAVEDDEPRRPAAPTARSQQETPVARQSSQAASATALAEPPVAKPPVPVAVSVPVAKADPAPAPALPRTTTSVEIATPASRPLQPRPISPPVPTETAPAFFTPPPPVRPITPVAPEPDRTADAPVPLPAADQVVVEVTSFSVPAPAPAPPASIITQPIQVNSRPSGLPEIRSQVSGSDALPRLDVSLAGQDLSSAAAVLFADNGGQSVRTRVQLPQPGVETHKFSPDDFIVPPTAPQEMPPALDPFDPPAHHGMDPFEEKLPDHYLPIPLPGAVDPIPLDALDDASYDDLPDFDVSEGHSYYPGPDPDEEDSYFTDLSADDEIPPGLEAPAWREEELVGELTPAAPVEVPWNLQPASIPDDADFREFEAPAPPSPAPDLKAGLPHEDRYDEVPVNPLHEGSFGKLFSQQPGPGGEVPTRPAEPAANALPAPVTQGPAQPEGDVLEELFGGSLRSPEDSKKLSKTAVVMISCLVGAAVIAILMVVLLGQLFLGGREPEDSFKEGSVVESAAEKSKGGASAAPVTGNEPALDEVPATIDPVAITRDAVPDGAAAAEAPALSIDERVQQIVNGTGAAPGTSGSVIGQPSLDLVDNAIDQFNTPTPVEIPGLADVAPAPATPPAPAPTAPAPAAAAPPVSALEAAGSSLLGPAGQDPAGQDPAGSAARSLGDTGKSANYNPPASFAAPGPNESPLLRVNDLIDAFLRAPDWQTRIKYTYQGDSLQPAIKDYYKKWPSTRNDRYSQQLFQMEQSAELGGPYWVYLISTTDADQGFPLIIRVEDGNLKVDWEIYSEFNDRHFVRFRDGTMPRPSTFRVVIERVSDYYGTDREAFANVKDYYVYQVNPPYGDLNEFSEYAFVKKDSEVAAKLEKVVGLGDEPLAVIVTLDEKDFDHGVKHFVITDYLTEGWLR